MNRSKVISSNIESVGYDYLNLILEVEFKAGSIYQYFNVPVNTYNDFLSAPSAGKYLNRNIASKYDYINTHNPYEQSHGTFYPKDNPNERQKPVSQSDIKKAYYKLAHKFHPDHDPELEEIMKEINRLYSENDYRGLLFLAKKYNIS